MVCALNSMENTENQTKDMLLKAVPTDGINNFFRLAVR